MKKHKLPYKWGWFYWLKRYRLCPFSAELEPVTIRPEWHLNKQQEDWWLTGIRKGR